MSKLMSIPTGKPKSTMEQIEAALRRARNVEEMEKVIETREKDRIRRKEKLG
jgi:hypothetical protein